MQEKKKPPMMTGLAAPTVAENSCPTKGTALAFSRAAKD
jgi:hypothetical protein